MVKTVPNSGVEAESLDAARIHNLRRPSLERPKAVEECSHLTAGHEIVRTETGVVGWIAAERHAGVGDRIDVLVERVVVCDVGEAVRDAHTAADAEIRCDARRLSLDHHRAEPNTCPPHRRRIADHFSRETTTPVPRHGSDRRSAPAIGGQHSGTLTARPPRLVSL